MDIKTETTINLDPNSVQKIVIKFLTDSGYTVEDVRFNVKAESNYGDYSPSYVFSGVEVKANLKKEKKRV